MALPTFTKISKLFHIKQNTEINFFFLHIKKFWCCLFSVKTLFGFFLFKAFSFWDFFHLYNKASPMGYFSNRFLHVLLSEIFLICLNKASRGGYLSNRFYMYSTHDNQNLYSCTFEYHVIYNTQKII